MRGAFILHTCTCMVWCHACFLLLQQPTAGYQQTSKSLPDTNQPTTVKYPPQTENTCDNSRMLRLYVPTVLWTSNDLICGYITGIHFCQWTKASCHTSCKICRNPSKFYEHYLIFYMPIIIYVIDYSQLTLATRVLVTVSNINYEFEK